MMMKYCIELVLSGQSALEFMQSLLENQIKNTKRTGGSDWAKVYQVLVKKLGTYSKDLRNLERVSLVIDAQRVSEDLRIKQERERQEIKERIAACTCHNDYSRVSFQSLIDDVHQFEVIFKTAKNVIASACMMIAKAQTLIQDHKLKLANEKKKVEELETTRHRVQKELDGHSSNLEAL